MAAINVWGYEVEGLRGKYVGILLIIGTPGVRLHFLESVDDAGV